jgi:hypothetical protein
LVVAAEIIRFGEYWNTRDVAPVSGDIEARLEIDARSDIDARIARLNGLAAEVFRALSLDIAALEYISAQSARLDR